MDEKTVDLCRSQPFEGGCNYIQHFLYMARSNYIILDWQQLCHNAHPMRSGQMAANERLGISIARRRIQKPHSCFARAGEYRCDLSFAWLPITVGYSVCRAKLHGAETQR